MIGNEVNYDGQLVFDITKPDGTLRKLMDVSKINKFGWKAKIGIKEGIKNTIEEVRNILS